MIALYQAAGHWMEDDDYLPEPGDVIFYDWEDSGTGDNRGASDHVGLVYRVDGDLITVIEGNCGNQVATRTIWRDGRCIRGYGLPDYAAAAAAEQVIIEDGPAAAAPEEPVGADAPGGPEPGVPDQGNVTLSALPEGWSYVPLPTLQIGDGGEGSPLEEAVRAAQLLLKGRGFPVGWMGADGDFGRKTESAVGQYQRDRVIERDGIIGPETWRKLICE
jgi:peptidoglycan hydrolase-like protein with peptidoglycan-binding domain